MPRWDYDTVFYRVFCITLLGITFTFTVILTNVFIDIDGLLFKKNKEHMTVNSEKGELHAQLNFITPNVETAYDYKDYGNEKEPYDIERTKRSIEIQDAFKTLKDVTIKKVLSSRLAALLEDLDKEESEKNKGSQENAKKSNDDEKEKTEKSKEVVNDKENTKEKDVELIDLNKSRDNFESEIMDYVKRVKKQEKEQNHMFATNEEMRHLAMHNIILQGLVGHMDLNEVYNKMHILMDKLDKTQIKNIKKDMSDALYPMGQKGLFEELVNCKELKEQIDGEMKSEAERDNSQGSKKAKKVMIKTIIDISSLSEKTNQRDTSKENVNGIIKLIYNGNELKFKRVEGITITEKPKSKQRIDKFSRKLVTAEEKLLTTTKTPRTDTYVPKMYTNKIISDYLRKMSESGGLFNETKFGKRLKRHINIQFDNEDNSTKKLTNPASKDDELFLEIETHFNSKGLKGADKKKMIRDLISKIQKAIRTEKENMVEKPKRHKHLHVKKRTQNPLDKEDHKPMTHEKPIYFLVRRDSDPISKSVAIHDKQPVMTDQRGDFWHQKYNQPRFLGEQKGINSIEMGELTADYSQGMQNTISERVQKPLNIQALYNPLDPSGAKFVMKDIAGSGFSIGFNQYVDDPPDAASMNLFSGIENIIKTYHQKYDGGMDPAPVKNNDRLPDDIPRISVNQEYPPNQYPENTDYLPNQEYPENRGNDNRGSQEYLPPESNQHTIVRRSIEKIKRDFHSNEYNIIYNNIFKNKPKKKKGHAFTKKYALKFIDDNIFAKDLSPSEILSLANILGRKKRTINVKKISNLHSHRSLNRYLNTKSMASKMIFQHNKRNKRQIDKIRIVAKDRSSTKKQKLNSAEEIFVLASNENMFSDRSIVRQIDGELNEEHKNNLDEHYDIVSSNPSKQQSEEHYDIITAQTEPVPEYIEHQVHQEPYYVAPQSPQVPVPAQEMDENDETAYDVPGHSSEQNYDSNFFITRSRHNSLMSKYPHIFMDEITRSKEEYRPETFVYERVDDKISDNSQKVNTAEHIQMPENEFAQNVIPKTSDMQGIVGLYSPQENNYKLTVKILPKNGTGLDSGFKETHTSINKSYNKNGLIYTSLVNVSEISKVEKINNETGFEAVTPHPFVQTLNEEQTKMRSIIQEHKNRIDVQLAHLMQEKEKLQHIEYNNSEFLKEHSSDNLFVAPLSSPGRTLTNVNNNKELEIQEAATTTERPSTTTQQLTTEPHTTETLPPTTTTEPVSTVTEDHFKSNLIKKISKNEHMTDEILKKIDKNTAILERFLEKIINKMDRGNDEITTQKPTTPRKPMKYREPEPSYNAYDLNGNLNPPIARPEDFLEKIPEIFFKHASYAKLNSSVPFVYAFQRPYMSQNSKDKNIANVVYQGHIHTQSTHNIPEIAFRNNQQGQAFPPTNEHERSYQARGAQSSQSLQKLQNIKPIEPNYPNIQPLKKDQSYQSIRILKKDQNYPNTQSIKTDQRYPNMHIIKTEQKYPDAKANKSDYPNKETITTGQNYENIQTTKTEENYENVQPIKPDQSFSINIKTNQNFDNVQARKEKQNYDNMSIKTDENYETMTRKQWNDKITDNKEWKKNLRAEDIPKSVVVPSNIQKNSTKFFIDELESEFKVVIPIDGKKKF